MACACTSNYRTILRSLFLCSGLFAIQSAQAQDEDSAPLMIPQGWSGGAAYVSSKQNYRGLKSDSIAVPFIGYESERVYLRGLTAGWIAHRSRQQQIAVTLNAELFRFRPQETNDAQMQQLDRRNLSFTLGLQHRYATRHGSFTTHVKTDVTSRHTGQLATFRYAYPLNRPGQAWQLSPEIGFNYFSQNYVDYYYGVSAEESMRSGLAAYRPSSAINPVIGLSGYRYFTPRLSGVASYSLARNDSEISRSPMVKGRSTRALFFGFSYRF
ncbi:MAG: MipA/OmpV family protein [Aliidiomarina sp.]|uniref:MipA/OmpV family protein n=1 Tax=Aliidiomarina sp. TaxID=1872439 RepID=UPI0025B8CAEB|nr:MipA/OmpV family protein [Aliidiomarina sp.]MCH8502620.1 MipA/OmpV family protein [Aliidiomarina sp.]